MAKAQKHSRTKRGFYMMAFTACFMLFASVGGLVWIKEAQALRISMKRIVFEGPKRSDILTIMNNTANEQTYRLGWRRFRMDERRSLVNIDDDSEAAGQIKWAEDMIRYAPRRVTVPAGGTQQVRILLRRPRDLEEGEYRAHLWIVTEADTERFAAGDEQAAEGQQKFKLSMMPALTLPVFVRHGDLEAAAEITDASLSRIEDGSSVAFTLHRSGNRSLYGDIKVTCTAGGSDYIGHHVRGIAVYTEVDKRIFEYDFTYPEDRADDCAQVRIEYIADQNDSQYSGEVMASAVAQ